MTVDSSDIKNNPLLNPLLLAEKFTDQRLFHNTDTEIRVLNLNDVQPGESLLDLGCGKNTLCQKLRKSGIHAVGLDVTSIDNGQQPDIIGTSNELESPNNSYDHVTSFWGGLAYPIEDIGTIEKGSSEIEKIIVSTFLTQLRESIRVAAIDVRINPWSVTNFFEALGVKTVKISEYDEIGIIAVNFKELFSKMGLEATTGEIYNEGLYSESWRNESIILKKIADFTMEPLEELIRTTESTDKPLLIRVPEILASEPKDGEHPIAQCLHKLKAWQGLSNRSQKQIDDIKFHTYNGNLYLDHNQEQIALDIFGITDLSQTKLTQDEIGTLQLQINRYNINRSQPNIDEQKVNLKSLLSPIISSQFIN